VEGWRTAIGDFSCDNVPAPSNDVVESTTRFLLFGEVDG
jgi:hypothetical protein